MTSHTYATGAARTVTLTVTDDHGNSDTDTVVATTTAPSVATPITFIAAAATNGNRTSHAVTVPASVKAGDALVLFLAANTTTPKYTDPAGWTVIQSKNGDGTVVRACCKVATASDAGSAVKVTSSAYAKSDITVVAYRSISNTSPIAASASKVDNTSGAAHVSPAVTAVGSPSWLVTYWADKSTSTSGWTAPAGQSIRAKTFGSSAGHISALLTDTNGPSRGGRDRSEDRHRELSELARRQRQRPARRPVVAGVVGVGLDRGEHTVAAPPDRPMSAFRTSACAAAPGNRSSRAYAVV